jgi:hypothetical protein
MLSGRKEGRADYIKVQEERESSKEGKCERRVGRKEGVEGARWKKRCQGRNEGAVDVVDVRGNGECVNILILMQAGVG